MCHFSCWPVSPASTLRPVVISQKPSKIDPQLLWNTTRKLPSLILLPYSDPDPEPWCHTEHDRHLAVNCSKQSATLGTCCLQSSCVVLMSPSLREGGPAFLQCNILVFKITLTNVSPFYCCM